MPRIFPYLGLFVSAVLLQIFLFDNLSISVYLNPLIYIVFIAMIPLDARPVTLLGAGLLLGVTMDFAMGAAGINTIATLPIAFFRTSLAGITCGRENVREGGVPSPERLGHRKFVNYLLSLTFLHHAVFFLLEALSWEHILHTALRIAVSTVVSTAFIWIIARIFTVKLPGRI